MVDESSFMKMLLHVLHVEAETDNRSERWEEELTASGACNASGVVDVSTSLISACKEALKEPKTCWVCCTGHSRRLREWSRRMKGWLPSPSQEVQAILQGGMEDQSLRQ
eukprot:3735047-Amphidinium_carterae.1